MPAKTVVELMRSFQARLPNSEQAERIGAIRRGAVSMAALIFQGTQPGDLRERSIDLLRQSLMYAEEAICGEESSANGIEVRAKIVNKIAAGKGLSDREVGVLRGMLGLFAPEDVEQAAPAGSA